MTISIRSDAGKLGRRMHGLARKHPQTVRFATRQVADDALLLFEKTVATWTNKPLFTVEETRSSVKVGTDSPIYGYIDKGTRVRRALMSPDWISKTKPNVISSRSGRGKMLFVSRKLNRPGIQARNFSRIIKDRTQATAANTVRRFLRALYASEGFGI